MKRNDPRHTACQEWGQIKCKLNNVSYYNTAIARFRNQILSQVQADLESTCQASIPIVLPPPPPPVVPPATELSNVTILLNELSFKEAKSQALSLSRSARSILATQIEIQNPVFKIVGFSSLIVGYTNDTVVNITFLGEDGQLYSEQQTIAFADQVTMPGSYPTAASIQGTMDVGQIIATPEVKDNGLIDAVNLDWGVNYRIQASSSLSELIAEGMTSISILANQDFAIIQAHISPLTFGAFQLSSVFYGKPAVRFEIVNFASLQVRVEGEIPVSLTYLDTNLQLRLQEDTVSFSQTVTISGEFDSGIQLDGRIGTVELTEVEPITEPSFLSINSVRFNLVVNVTIRILSA